MAEHRESDEKPSQEKKPFSFGFTKKKDVKVLEKKEVKETDFVHALEGKEVKRYGENNSNINFSLYNLRRPKLSKY